LATVIKTNYSIGMIDMEKSVQRLVEAGVVEERVAKGYQRNTETKGIYYNNF